MKSYRPIIIASFTISLALIVSLLFSWREDRSHADLLAQSLPKVDAIVCLAGGKGRIPSAASLWLRYYSESLPLGAKPPKLYISGMWKGSSWQSFLKLVSPEVQNKINPEDVILEMRSLNTVQNAEYALKYAENEKWKSVLLTTSHYHLKRARFIFEKIFAFAEQPIAITSVPISNENLESFDYFRLSGVEKVKGLFYRLFWNPNLQEIKALPMPSPAISSLK